ncbi:hypothetical protein R3W88_024372 [Solanum pinnatisectum]|uniref:Uncharacterized protein n=1 Tax=Solanum pinnatisectum TaxID=50273 RepID=A0AAV9M2A2_9SOLN|nr:hypothetical protein R3W88_024372 [Solanum pinnatisectum]
MLKEGILSVKIKEEDICLQIKEWETTLIGCIIGDNPYELQMVEYVKKTQKNDANISDEATETPMVAQPSNEHDLGQRSGRQHVEENIRTEGIVTTIETDLGQRSGKQHVADSTYSKNILAAIGIDPGQWSGKKHAEECSDSTLEDQLEN